MRPVHAERLSRWLGDEAENISKSMVDWYGGPVPLAMPGGKVFAMPGGDFAGQFQAGGFASYRDASLEAVKRALKRAARASLSTAPMGFSSLSDLISEATTGGKRQERYLSKTGTLATSGAYGSLWNVGAFPAAGGTPSAIAAGAVPTNSTVGSWLQANAAGGDTLHFVSGMIMGSAAPNTLLVYDRLWHGSAVLHTTTGNQAVSGTPDRYTTTESVDNFCFLEVYGGSLGSTAHNATITYVDDAGNTAEAGSAQAVTASSVVTRIPFANWFYILNAGDRGCRNVTNIAFSAVSSGTSNIVVGRPMFFLPCPTAGIMVPIDGINSMFNLIRIKDNACLAFIEMKNVATATTYTGSVIMVSG